MCSMSCIANRRRLWFDRSNSTEDKLSTATLGDLAEANPKIKQMLEDPTIPHNRIADQVPFGETSVRRWRTKHNISLQPALPGLSTEAPQEPYDVPDEATVPDYEAENSALRSSNKRLYDALLKEKDKAGRLIEAVYRAAMDAALQYGTPAKPTPKPPRDKRTKQEEVALLHSTDWQRSKVTESFNSEIADDRIRQYNEKCQEITEIMRADHPVRHGVVLWTGDMLEGCKIFPGQEWEVDADLFDQLFGVVDMLVYAAQHALSYFETIDIVAEYGNHGRIGKPSDGFKKSDNFDRIAYEIARRRLLKEDRILTFKQSGEWYQHHEVGNYSFMAVHGDEIKSFGGNLPAYGILRKANAWSSGVVPEFRDLYIGHYHQSMQLQMANGGSVFMTGSIESHNEFAQEFVAATSDPSQRLNFINPDRGIVTYESRIWLN